MLPKQPFARRILIAFVLMTAVISGLFSLSIVLVVHYIEERLVSEEMQRTLATARHDWQEGSRLRLDVLTYFFASSSDAYPIPPALRELPEGFTEIVDESGAFYAWVEKENGETYILLQDQQDFELHEQALFHVVLGGFLLTLLLAFALARVMAGRVMAPLTRLAGQVRHRNQLHPLAPPLAPDYPQDEVGALAGAFDSTLGEVRKLLTRERLFTSDVSHELRTPLMVIAGSSELLAEANLPASAREPLARIQRACADMRALVEIFLHLARGKEDDADSLASGASLAQIAQQQQQRWQPLFAEKHLDFQVIEQSADSGLYHPTFLATVIANLLRNALHYTERGSVRLILQNGSFRVEDSGPGIPSAQHEVIFQPFVRGSNARGEGLGLGLSLARRICARQGWDISLDNQKREGCCFVVRLQSDTLSG